MSHSPARPVFFLAIPALTVAFLLGACTDGSPVSDGNLALKAPLIISPQVESSALSADARSVNLIRVTVQSVTSGATLAQRSFSVDPNSASWEIQIQVEFESGDSLVNVLIELMHAPEGGQPSVEWSGETGEFQLAASGVPVVRSPQVVRGPIANLGVQSISLEGPERVDEGEAFNVIATPITDGSRVGQPTVFFAVDAPDVVSQSDGQFVAVGPGIAVITATAGPASASLALVVVGTPNDVVVTPEDRIVDAVGSEFSFDAEVVDSRGVAIEGEVVDWTVVDESIVEHLGDGLFRSLRKGSTSVVATAVSDAALSGAATVEVDPRAISISVTPSEATLLVGATLQIAVGGEDGNGNPVESPEVAYASSDQAIASVAEDGVVTGVGVGSAEITVTARSGAQERLALDVVLIETDLALTASVDRARPVDGETVEFVLGIVNDGSEDASAIEILVELSEGLELVSRSVEPGGYDPDTRLWSIATLSSGAVGSLTISATVSGAPGDRRSIGTELSALEQFDTNTENDAASAAVVINAPPVAADDAVETRRDEGIALNLQGSDPDGDGVEYAIHSEPGHGTASLLSEDGRALYVPNSGFVGEDSFEFSVTDADGAVTVGTIEVTVLPPPPTAALRFQSDGLMDVGGTLATSLVALDAQDKVILRPDVTYTSSDPEVATVSGTGVVTGVSRGPVEITAVSGGVSASIELHVLAPGDVAATVMPVGGSPREAAVGSTFEVEVIIDLSRIAENGDLGSAQFELGYPAEIVEFVSAEVPIDGITADFSDDGAGRFRYAMVATEPTPDPEVRLVNLTFRVRDSADPGSLHGFELFGDVPLQRTNFEEINTVFFLSGRVKIAR